MQQITVGSKYQVVIPKEARKKMKSLRPGRQVIVIPVDENTATIKVAPKSWVDETYGMMKEAWKDIDPIAEVEKARDEWVQKEKELRNEFR